MTGRAFVRVTWDVLPEVMKGHDLTQVTSNLPADATTEHIVVDDIRRELRVHVVSASLPDVPEGQVVPEYHVQLVTRWPGPETRAAFGRETR